MEPSATGDWGQAASQTFIDYGRYFVPEREVQIATICRLLPPGARTVFDICCGEGLLAQAMLAALPQAVVYGLDGSPLMLARAADRMLAYGQRFVPQQIDIAERSWRVPGTALDAVVSSLAIHHLDGPGKQQLFADMYAALGPGGVLVVADVVQPADTRGMAVAAAAWDAAVARRGIELDGAPDSALALFERERWNMYR